MVLSLDNLANAAIQKNDTVEKLVLTNNQLTTANSKLTEHVLQLEEQNTSLLHILEKYAGGSPGGIKAFTPTESSNVWDLSGYCWTHSFKVKRGHNSKTCKARGDRHQEGAIQQNIMGGSQANIKWTPK
eukprot:CCRYP_016887-RA/>CCRYP_016887-RA protein AED:0.46 eAED:0.46 QI:0/-1/0/1/-1/1/1/0/128